MNVPALEVTGVSKRYTRSLLAWFVPELHSAAQLALDNVSLTVRQGEFIGLLGPNGAGKTTMLKVISALLYPDSGTVRLYGADAFRRHASTSRLLGLVTCDERSFYWRLTGRQNLRFFATLYRVPRHQFECRCDELLDTLGLAEVADRPYDSYSSGMKQKLAIARGLLADPRMVLYDEPTRSLDPLSAQNIRHWILRERQRRPDQTHIIATNQLEEAAQLCDRVLIINRGAIVAQGTMAEIRDRFRRHDFEVHHITYRGTALDVDENRPAGLLSMIAQSEQAGVRVLQVRARVNSTALSAVLDRILQAGGTVLRCQTQQPSFEDVFCSVVDIDRSPLKSKEAELLQC